MNRKIALLLLVLLAVIFAPTHYTSAVASGNNPSANGHGNLTISGELRTFSFHALTRRDGTVKGSVTLHNRALDIFDRYDIDCLNVVGNTATLSGIITKSTDTDLIGSRAIFRVVDNGEGSTNARDQISLVAVLPAGSTIDCDTAGLVLPTLPIEGGNVQVTP